MNLPTCVRTGIIAAAAVAAPAAAFAQNAPPAMPTYAAPAPSYASADEVIHGRIASFDGQYALAVNDDRGFVDNVRLRQGTVINPTGIRLVTGMAVTIHGVNQGSTFAANQINTPYSSYGAVYGPVPVYGSIYPYPVYPYDAYPYPVYAYPYGYGRVSIGIGFGGYGHWGYGRFR
jgi:hypothetical protein